MVWLSLFGFAAHNSLRVFKIAEKNATMGTKQMTKVQKKRKNVEKLDTGKGRKFRRKLHVLAGDMVSLIKRTRFVHRNACPNIQEMTFVYTCQEMTGAMKKMKKIRFLI